MKKKNVLVTGGCGYIGSHCLVKLMEQGYSPVVLDDLSNSCIEVLERVKEITGEKPIFYFGDILNSELLDEIFSQNNISYVIHFAGKKSVNESQKEPIEYFSVNVGGTLTLLSAMKKAQVRKIIFSSTATVYDSSSKECLSEEDKLGPINNYGKSKLMVEEILEQVWKSDKRWNAVILRYFNPVGAHASGLLGEDPRGVPANIMPYISQVAIGKRDCLYVFGNDYKTRDGTGARDFIHVEDLASGHIAALRLLEKESSFEVINLGTGTNLTVLELVKAFEKSNGVSVPYKIVGRRPGDTGACYANPAKAFKVLGWRAEKNISDMCRDTWNWQHKNPNGYRNK